MKDLQQLKENYDNNEVKSIVVSKRNYDKLGKLGHFGDSYNTIISRLLENVNHLKLVIYWPKFTDLMTKKEFDEPSKGKMFDKELPLQSAQPDVFKITHFNPLNGAFGVDQSSSVNVTFNKPVGEFSVGNNFWVEITTEPPVLGGVVHGTRSLSSDGKTIIFKPSNLLQSSLSYTVKVKSRLQATTFEFLGSDNSSSFITGGPPNPNACNFWLAHAKDIVDVTAKSSESTFPARNAIDKNLNTKWMSTSTLKPWIKADLQHVFPVCKVDIAWADGSSRQYSFIISVSSDDINFAEVFSGNSTGTTTSPERYSFAETNARYVRIMLSESTDTVAQISEMAVIGRFT